MCTVSCYCFFPITNSLTFSPQSFTYNVLLLLLLLLLFTHELRHLLHLEIMYLLHTSHHQLKLTVRQLLFGTKEITSFINSIPVKMTRILYPVLTTFILKSDILTAASLFELYHIKMQFI